MLISNGLTLQGQAPPTTVCLWVYLFAVNLYRYAVSLVAVTCVESQ